MLKESTNNFNEGEDLENFDLDVNSFSDFGADEVKIRRRKKEGLSVNQTRAIKDYMASLNYINSYLRLPSKYTYKVIEKELSTISNRNKVDYIRTKLFEILLTLSVTNRTSLIFQENNRNSDVLRYLWEDQNNYYRDHIHQFKVEMNKVI